MTYRILLIVLGIAALGLQFRFWLGNEGVSSVNQLRHDIRQIQTQIQHNRSRNLALRVDIDNLKTRSEALEEIAREQLGLIRRDEYFFRLLQPKSQ